MRRIFLAVLGLLLALPAAATVNAEDYRQFWLWGGVRPQAALDHADMVYVLQGHVDTAGGFQAEGAVPSYFPVAGLWLVYRVDSLSWSPAVVRNIALQWREWQRFANHPLGIQIDFDARTRHLDQYAAFLRALKPQLPANCRLGITGLLDWTRTGDVATLNGLAGTVDELVVQTYRGRQTVPEYARYLHSLRDLRLPFKLGLVQGGEWEPVWQERLAELPGYKGEVVFLLNPRRQVPLRPTAWRPRPE